MGELQVWVYEDDFDSPVLVGDANRTLDPEEWVVDHGVEKFPDGIYFFAELIPL